ncbi:toll/interleukin-1 receptor domain-containing protein [Bacillus toyonensis]|uniref:toll/interleukin-1 receptor domain-containing protein n=1 Tax=Bacillus toyonensis TaxID=155322 RepID=UPI003D65E3DB
MNSKKLNKLGRDFRVISSRFLTTKYGTEQSDLSRFLNFIESNEVVFNFIKDCIDEEYDFADIIENKEWNTKFQLPFDKKNEISYIYQLLKYIQKNNGFISVSFRYGSGKKIQDHIDAFNNEVTVHLINYIREYIEDLIIEFVPLTPNSIDEQSPNIFISYCWSDISFADLIEDNFKKLGYQLTRDQRDLQFKDSIKEFMNSIGEHDFVISIISNNYLKSINCMYEISEVMRSRKYKDKMLLVILKDSDLQYIDSTKYKITSDFGANVYSMQKRIEYTTYWENKEKEYEMLISQIVNDLNKIPYLQELKQIKNIASNIGDFLTDISDWNNTDLSNLNATNYKAFLDEINQVQK